MHHLNKLTITASPVHYKGGTSYERYGPMGIAGCRGPTFSGNHSESYYAMEKTIQEIGRNNSKLIEEFVKYNCKFVPPNSLGIHIQFDRSTNEYFHEVLKAVSSGEQLVTHSKPSVKRDRLGIKQEKKQEYGNLGAELEERNRRKKEKFDHLVETLKELDISLDDRCTDRDYGSNGLEFVREQLTVSDDFYEWDEYLGGGSISIDTHCGTELYKELLENGTLERICRGRLGFSS